MSPTASFDVFYDAQCEVCQAFASWLRVLDRRGRARLVSGGEFSRTELVRSFVRPPGETGILPTVFELRSRGPTSAAR